MRGTASTSACIVGSIRRRWRCPRLWLVLRFRVGAMDLLDCQIEVMSLAFNVVVGAEYMPTCGSEPLTIGPREGHFSNSSGQSRWTEFVHDFREALFTCVANQTGIPRTENDNRFSRSKVIRNLRWKRSFHGSSSYR